MFWSLGSLGIPLFCLMKKPWLLPRLWFWSFLPPSIYRLFFRPCVSMMLIFVKPSKSTWAMSYPFNLFFWQRLKCGA